MKTCRKCPTIKECDCGKHGYCDVQQGFYELDADADECEYYDGPDDEPVFRPHYQTETQRDNPRDPVIER